MPGKHEGKLHLPEDVPPFFRFETGGFLDFERDHRQTREQDEGAKRSPLPVFHDRNGNEGEVRIGQPIHLFAEDQAPEIVEDAEISIEHEAAHQPDDGKGGRAVE